jgi:hypothetical protein
MDGGFQPFSYGTFKIGASIVSFPMCETSRLTRQAGFIYLRFAESYARSRKPFAWPEGRVCIEDNVFSIALDASNSQIYLCLWDAG